MTSRQRRLAELQPYVEWARGIKGWAMGVELAGLGPGPRWDYMGRARELVAGARTVLDMGTGGGERFLEILEEYGGLAVATEGWSGNVHVASSALSPFGAAVVHASGLYLPFANASFDLVLNRHNELTPADVARILSPGGSFLTQQVGHDNWKELRAFFPRQTDFGPKFDLYREGFLMAGLTIDRAETHDTPVACRSLGDLVYLLTVTPWTVPGFDLEADLDALLALEQALYKDDHIGRCCQFNQGISCGMSFVPY